MNVDYIIPKSETYLLNIPKELVNSHIEITFKKVKSEISTKSVIEMIKKTAGIIQSKELDASDWQRNLRNDWER